MHKNYKYMKILCAFHITHAEYVILFINKIRLYDVTYNMIFILLIMIKTINILSKINI